MNTYIAKKDICYADGTIAIEAGKLVLAEKHELSKLNGKGTISVSPSELKDLLKPCPLTLKDGEILVMELRTDYHTYHAMGRNPMDMYRKIIMMYNRNASSNYNTSNFHKEEYMHDYHCLVYKVNADLFYFDDEYFSMGESGDKRAVEIGDWFSLYRKSTMWHYKDYFKQTMR